MTGSCQKSTDQSARAGRLLEKDLEDLRRLAVKRGADEAAVISAADIIVDPRVRFKCMIPRCYMSGSCGHCPPHGYSPDETRRILSGYQRAVFFRVRVKSSIMAAERVHEAIESGVMDPRGNAMNLGGYYILAFSIVKVLQKKARAAGYRTFGFAAGNCRDPFCHLRPVCRDLMTDRGCRHPNLSSYSMESAGMDVYRMAAGAGWDQYPIGGSCRPESVPRGSLMGLVLVGQKSDAPGPAMRETEAGGGFSEKGKTGFSARIRRMRQNVQALEQVNLTPVQVLNMLREPLLWFRVTRNFREIEGSWYRAVRQYAYMFEGVPDKRRKRNDG